MFAAASSFTVGFILATSMFATSGHTETIDLGPGCRIFEDGSATCQDEQGGWHFPADTFEWDCHIMGNRTCGPNPSR